MSWDHLFWGLNLQPCVTRTDLWPQGHRSVLGTSFDIMFNAKCFTIMFFLIPEILQGFGSLLDAENMTYLYACSLRTLCVRLRCSGAPRALVTCKAVWHSALTLTSAAIQDIARLKNASSAKFYQELWRTRDRNPSDAHQRCDGGIFWGFLVTATANLLADPSTQDREEQKGYIWFLNDLKSVVISVSSRSLHKRLWRF